MRLTDAGMTPYRGMRKLRDVGKLGPGRTVAMTGIGGLGSYAVQYAKHQQFPFVGLIKHNVTKVKLEDINENLDALGRGDVVGRQVIVFN